MSYIILNYPVVLNISWIIFSYIDIDMIDIGIKHYIEAYYWDNIKLYSILSDNLDYIKVFNPGDLNIVIPDRNIRTMLLMKYLNLNIFVDYLIIIIIIK